MVSKKILASLVIIIVALSCVVTYQGLLTGPVQASKQTLNVNVTPSGSSFKLAPEQNITFTVSASNGTAPYTYVWKLAPSAPFNLSINGVIYDFSFTDSFTSYGQDLTLCYPYATEEYVTIQAVVTDSSGLSGFSEKIVVADPYTSPGFKFDASTADASIICSADGKGWFRATNATTGAVISALTSINPSTTINGALAYGGVIAIRKGAYTGAQLVVPATATLIAEIGTTGIKYTSIATGAKVDEPAFNACFGGYQSGSYTVVSGSSAVASGATWYLAFKPDHSISYTSTNASYVWNTVISACSAVGGGKILQVGNQTLTTKILLNMTRHIEITATQGSWFNGQILPMMEISGVGMDGWTGTGWDPAGIAAATYSMNDVQLNGLHFYYNGQIQSGDVLYIHKVQNDRRYQGPMAVNNLVIATNLSLVAPLIPTNTAFVGLHLEDEIGITFTDPSISGFGTGIQVTATIWQGTGNRFLGPHISYCDYGVWYHGCSQTNEYWETPYFMSCKERSFYVDTDGLMNLDIRQLVINEMSNGRGPIYGDESIGLESNAQLTTVQGGLVFGCGTGIKLGPYFEYPPTGRVKTASITQVDFYRIGVAINTSRQTTIQGNLYGLVNYTTPIVTNGPMAVILGGDNNKGVDGWQPIIFDLPTTYSWPSIAGYNGTAGFGFAPSYGMDVYTGTTAGSISGVRQVMYGLNNGTGYTRQYWDPTRQLELSFDMNRHDNDSAIAYVQFVAGNNFGELADEGFGITINNLAVYASAYGTALQTQEIADASNNLWLHFDIIYLPNQRIDFYVNRVLVASLSGTALPTTAKTNMQFDIGIINTYNTSATIDVRNIQFKLYP